MGSGVLLKEKQKKKPSLHTSTRVLRHISVLCEPIVAREIAHCASTIATHLRATTAIPQAFPSVFRKTIVSTIDPATETKASTVVPERSFSRDLVLIRRCWSREVDHWGPTRVTATVATNVYQKNI